MQEINVLMIQNTDKIFDDMWLEDWLEKQSPHKDKSYISGDFKVIFSTQFEQADYCVMLNRLDQNKTICVGKDNIFALQQEPYIPSSPKYHIPFKNEFAILERTYKHCRKVFAFVPELLQKDPKKERYIPHHPMMYWMLYSKNKPHYDEIFHLACPTKNRIISCIASQHKAMFPGHRDRREFVLWLKSQPIGKGIDFYGAGTPNELTNKVDGLAPYKYSIAIENSRTSHYFTEKIIDCFLAYTMPIYCGAPNIGEYFPDGSYVCIDINKPLEALKIIQETIANNQWEKNLANIKKARELCLVKYNFIHSMGEIIIKDFQKNGAQPLQTLTIKRFRRSFKDKIKRNLWRIKNKFNAFLKRNAP
ncbi:glycosyltransferase family 10 [Helicobacter sp. 11S02596-1]|uniref:glycosyltransferase family 10 domain-containing protein n=1 Tax=Helicobacter sp. 11S02596-1 TaxID=1476194 RepID=UPI000BA7819E|nr:glycosyltransferase family 10 [Helicobacter sp. 11S02596-1]PAF43934.1 hypothetical protein BJI48_03865 [Helicobacter sp. 11S02596-1]